MRETGWIVGLCAATLLSAAARADDGAVPPADHIEAIQSRAWIKSGSLMLVPQGSIAFNDPFLVRGGGGLGAVYWIRSLVGLSLDVNGWGQAPTNDALIAQRELHAQIRPTALSWSALGGAEIAPVDGKIAFGSGIVPFEMFLRLGVGAAASTEAINGSPTFAFSAAIGARWFLTPHLGLDTSFDWQSASMTRSVNGAPTDSLDTIVAFELGIPFRIGGGP